MVVENCDGCKTGGSLTFPQRPQRAACISGLSHAFLRIEGQIVVFQQRGRRVKFIVGRALCPGAIRLRERQRWRKGDGIDSSRARYVCDWFCGLAAEALAAVGMLHAWLELSPVEIGFPHRWSIVQPQCLSSAPKHYGLVPRISKWTRGSSCWSACRDAPPSDSSTSLERKISRLLHISHHYTDICQTSKGVLISPGTRPQWNKSQARSVREAGKLSTRSFSGGHHLGTPRPMVWPLSKSTLPGLSDCENVSNGNTVTKAVNRIPGLLAA